MQYGIRKKCESIIGLFGTEDEQIVPLEYDFPTFSYKLSRQSSIGIKLHSFINAHDGSWITYTADNYSKYGLMALYDAKENVGFGEHSNTTSTWKNLAYSSSHSTDMTVNHTDWWSDNCINLDGSDNFASSPSFKTVDGISIECCFKIEYGANDETDNRSYCPISIGDDNTWFSNRRRILISSSEDRMVINAYQKKLNETSCESSYSYSIDSFINELKTVYTYMPSCEFNADTQRMFVNSTNYSSFYNAEFTPNPSRYVNGLLVGLDGWGSDGKGISPFVGKIMRISIYGKSLTEDTIRLHHSIDIARYG